MGVALGLALALSLALCGEAALAPNLRGLDRLLVINDVGLDTASFFGDSNFGSSTQRMQYVLPQTVHSYFPSFGSHLFVPAVCSVQCMRTGHGNDVGVAAFHQSLYAHSTCLCQSDAVGMK